MFARKMDKAIQDCFFQLSRHSSNKNQTNLARLFKVKLAKNLSHRGHPAPCFLRLNPSVRQKTACPVLWPPMCTRRKALRNGAYIPIMHVAIMPEASEWRFCCGGTPHEQIDRRKHCARPACPNSIALTASTTYGLLTSTSPEAEPLQ